MLGPDALEGSGQATVGSVLRQAAAELGRAGIEGAGGDARRLLAAVLGLPGAALLSGPERVLSAHEVDRLRQCVVRRATHEPVSRILGERDFYGRAFAISPAVLDPRPDSETLITAALEIARSEGWMSRPVRVLDVGTGSGCLLLTLLCELPQARGTGSDISEAALEVARDNARRLGLAQRATWLQADALEGIVGPFDLLIANPPYVRSAEIAHLDPEVRDFDPHRALDGGADGLAVYRRIFRTISTVVANGWIVLEVGHDQADAVAAALLSSASGAISPAGIRIHHDVSGRRRCVAAGTRTRG